MLGSPKARLWGRRHREGRRQAMSSKVTYRQQYTRCGKERCRKCREGAGHGPYWYAYWSENGRTISKYIGIRLPDPIDTEQQAKAGPETRRASAPGAASSAANHSAIHPTPAPAAQNQRVKLQVDTQSMRIYVLGQFRIDRLERGGWEPVVNRTWRRRRARALLGCLLSSPGRRLGRERAMEALWPDLDMETAANRLNGAVHELRRILEPELARPAASRMLRLERDILELAGRSQIWVDAETFESLLNEANNMSVSGPDGASHIENIERLLEESALLYSGDYLPEELYSEWSAPRREALRRDWIGLLLKLSELREKRGSFVTAMEPLNRLLAADPTDETAVQRLMLLLTQLDRRGEALNTYRKLATRLQRLYDSEPLPETRDLYEQLRLGTINRNSLKALVSPDVKSSWLAPNMAERPGAPAQNTPPTASNESSNAPAPEAIKLTLRGDSTGAGFAQAQEYGLFVVGSQLGRTNQGPLIGRSLELQMLRQLLLSIECAPRDSAALEHNTLGPRPWDMKTPHMLLLVGEAGIGKTRLAEELSHDAFKLGWAIAWTRAYEQEGTIPYRPWIELLRTFLKDNPPEALLASFSGSAPEYAPDAAPNAITLLERLSTLLPELHELLPAGHKTNQPLPPEQERLHVWEATLEILILLSKKAPLLLVFDDIHWTDNSSRELLAYITRHIQDQRILLIGTCRDAELAPAHGLRALIADLRREQALMTLAVQPLSPGQIAELVSHLPQEIVQSIQAQVAGNPFFAEELARVSESALASAPQLADRSMIMLSPFLAIGNEGGLRGKSYTSSELPDGITAVLERRLSRLSIDCQNLLAKATVLGGSFEFQQLLHMTSPQTEDTVLDLLEEALHAGLLTEEGKGARVIYHFWHPLIVSHLYEGLSAARCAQLHRRAAEALIQAHAGREHEMAASIVHHLTRGGGASAQVTHFAELAGNQAYLQAAFDEAEHYYSMTIQAMAGYELPEGKSISGIAGQQFVQAVAGVADPTHIARLLERICECCEVRGGFEEARDIYTCILELRQHYLTFDTAEEQRQEARVQALIWREIGRTWSSNGDYGQAKECYERAKQVMSDAGIHTGAAWACVHLQQGSICILQGNYDEARRFVLEALDMLEAAVLDGAPSGDARSAHPQLQAEKSVAFAQGKDRPASLPNLLQTRIERAIVGDPLEIGTAHEFLGIIAASVGLLSEALTHIYKALAIFEQHDYVIEMVKVCGNLGAVHAMKSENSVANVYFRRSLELAERIGSLPDMTYITGNLGEMAARSGDLFQAEEWLSRGLAIAESINDRDHLSWSHVSLAATLIDLGQLEGAAEHIRSALAISRAIKSPRNIGHALIALGDLRVTQSMVAANLPEPQAALIRRRLLLRAQATLQRAMAMEEIEIELVVEGKVILAGIFFLLEDYEQALQIATQSLEEARQHEITRMIARSQRLLGRILAARGDFAQAASYFEQAMQVFQQHEMRLDYARALHGYGAVLLQQGAINECLGKKGLTLLQEARELFVISHAAIDLQLVNDLLAHPTARILET